MTVVSLDDYRPHETYCARCAECRHGWHAVVPDGTYDPLECPKCRALAGRVDRIPLRCLGCGNAVMADRRHDEDGAIEIAMSNCDVCAPDDGCELFYGHPTRGLLSFGDWMDAVEGGDGEGGAA